MHAAGISATTKWAARQGGPRAAGNAMWWGVAVLTGLDFDAIEKFAETACRCWWFHALLSSTPRWLMGTGKPVRRWNVAWASIFSKQKFDLGGCLYVVWRKAQPYTEFALPCGQFRLLTCRFGGYLMISMVNSGKNLSSGQTGRGRGVNMLFSGEIGGRRHEAHGLSGVTGLKL